MSGLRQVHPELIVQYDLAYASAKAYAEQEYQGATWKQLRQAAFELRNTRTGTFTIRDRAWRDARLAVVEDKLQKPMDQVQDLTT